MIEEKDDLNQACAEILNAVKGIDKISGKIHGLTLQIVGAVCLETTPINIDNKPLSAKIGVLSKEILDSLCELSLTHTQAIEDATLDICPDAESILPTAE